MQPQQGYLRKLTRFGLWPDRRRSADAADDGLRGLRRGPGDHRAEVQGADRDGRDQEGRRERGRHRRDQGDRQGHRREQEVLGLRRQQRGTDQRPVHRDEPRQVPRGHVPEHRRATCSTTRSRPRSRATSTTAAASSASAPRSRPSPAGSSTPTSSATRASGRTDVQTGTVKVADRVHDATKNLPEYWNRTDAWYNFTRTSAASRTCSRRSSRIRSARSRRASARRDRRRHDGRRPSGRLVQGLQGRPLVLHRARKHPGELRRADLRRAPRRRDRLGGGRRPPSLQRLRRDRARELPADQDQRRRRT